MSGKGGLGTTRGSFFISECTLCNVVVGGMVWFFVKKGRCRVYGGTIYNFTFHTSCYNYFYKLFHGQRKFKQRRLKRGDYSFTVCTTFGP